MPVVVVLVLDGDELDLALATSTTVGCWVAATGRCATESVPLARCSRRILDIEAWMRLPVEQRLVDLRRTNAWPLIMYLIGTGRLRLDMDLAVTKNLTGLGAIMEAEHAVDFAAARDAGRRLGWTQTWVDTVLGECLAVVVAWHGATMAGLTGEVLGDRLYTSEIGARTSVPAVGALVKPPVASAAVRCLLRAPFLTVESHGWCEGWAAAGVGAGDEVFIPSSRRVAYVPRRECRRCLPGCAVRGRLCGLDAAATPRQHRGA